jgi:spermidine/putrescine transport system permease protein
VISYPLAYWIAFRGGRWKNLLLLFIVAPFFVHLPDPDARLGDDPLGQRLRREHAPDASRARAERAAARDLDRRSDGITYNFLPFMALPLYVSLEQIDGRMIEAAEDLYASKLAGVLARDVPALAARASSPGRCSRSSRRPATSSTPSCSGSPTTT